MASLTIHNLDPKVERQLRLRAEAHLRSMEAEASEILARGVAESGQVESPGVEDALLQQRRKIGEQFISGAYGADLTGFEEGREADRETARVREGDAPA